MKFVPSVGFLISSILLLPSIAIANEKTCTQWLEQGALFCDSFEQDINSEPNNQLRWKAPFNSETNRYGMMIGPGNQYDRSEDRAIAGKYALRLDFEGRNGICNECGIDRVKIDGLSFYNQGFTATHGENLAEAPYFQPDANRAIYNLTDSFSKWRGEQIYGENSDNDTILADVIQNDMSGQGTFNINDEIGIARQCGVDGKVGGNIIRRNDCDIAINWLEGVEESMHEPGETLYMRYYFYVPEETVMPDITIKLAYFRTQTTGTEQIPVINNAGRTGSRANTFHTEGSIGNAEGVKTFKIAPIMFEKNQWYYFEQAFTRSSSDTALDGRYRWWLNKLEYSETGQLLTAEYPEAIYDVSGFNLAQVKKNKGMSVPGNWPHENDAIGYMYFDNVVISNSRIGNQ